MTDKEFKRLSRAQLIDNFSVNVNAFDLITGYRADDSYFDYAESFLNNGISVEQLAKAMKLGKLGEDFVKMFIASPLSRKIENGEPAYLVGKSGIELVMEIVSETTGKEITAEHKESIGRSKEYWIGWAVAYYQWYSARKFGDIFKVLSYEDLQNMYPTLHEADITKFADIADARMKEFFPDTNLRRIRTTYGCTQAKLAKRSGVTLRSIQMYEQRNKDINKASVEKVYRIAKILGCTIEDLIEK